jgi:hypothetical protein
MAEIVQSLFGVTPEMYQRQQQDRMDAQALRFAQLDPFQQANFAIGRGANMLGGAIGGALGGQDPELQRITARQQIARQIDLTDPASIQSGMAMLQQAGDTVGLQQLAQIFRQQQESGALVAQRNAAAARESKQAVPADIQVANEMATLQETIGRLQDAPASPERDRDLRLASGRLSQLERLTTKPGEKPLAPNIKEVGVAEKSRAPVYLDVNNNEQFTFGMGPDGKQVRVPFTGGVDRTTAKTTVDARPPGERVPVKDWMDFSTKILSGDPTMVRTNTIISDAPSAIDIIRTSTDNDISAAALPGALARLTGEGKNMSNQDVARFARTGGLDDRLAADAVKFFTGRGTKVKKDQAERFATALYRGALIQQKERLQNQAEQFGYLDSPNYKTTLQQLDNQLARFKLAPKPGAADAPAGTPPAGGLTAAEQAELDQLRSRYRRNPQ